MVIRLLALAAGGALLATALLSLPAAAAIIDSEQTNVDITFLQGTDVVDALDPDTPAQFKYLEAGDIATGQSGPLSLDVAPSFSFGSVERPLQTLPLARQYPAQLPARPYLQISDLRGKGGGWKLKASATEFTDGQGASIPGAQIILTNGSIRSSNSALTPPAVTGTIIINCAAEQTPATIAQAPPGAGMGGWALRWYPQDDEGNYAAGENRNVVLHVPAVPVRSGTHTATLQWTLENAP